MSIYLGPLYFEEKDLFLLLALGLLIGGWLAGIYLPFISYPAVIIIVLLFLIAKGLTIKTHESLVLIIFLSAFILTNFLELSVVILYLFFSFLFLRALKII
ncbi:hypothetical protein FJZ40_04625 [Candidatus Shapirobacteria bacterium]|nr:hypothetical protein [Candidatus Shapirobacteria bacterium]